MKNEITPAKQTTTAIAKPSTNILDISSFEGFNPADMKPTNIVLVQGDSGFKDTLGAKNGQFVCDNMIVGDSFEFIPIKSEKFLDVFKSDPTVENAPREDYIGTVKDAPTILSKDGRIIELTPVKEEEQYPLLFIGSDGFYYQCKTILVLALNGLPYKMIFKSRPKQIAIKNILETIFKASKFHHLEDFIEGVYKMHSQEMTSKIGKKFLSLQCSFVRKSEDNELIVTSRYRTIDVSKTDKEEDSAPY